MLHYSLATCVPLLRSGCLGAFFACAGGLALRSLAGQFLVHSLGHYAMSLEHASRPLAIISLLLAAFPVFLIIALLTYAFTACVYLGHWPSYSNPDPKQLGWWAHHSALELGFVGFPIVTMLAFSLAIVGRLRSPEFPLGTVVITALVSIALAMAFAKIDPGGVMAWFWD